MDIRASMVTSCIEEIYLTVIKCLIFITSQITDILDRNQIFEKKIVHTGQFIKLSPFV